MKKLLSLLMILSLVLSGCSAKSFTTTSPLSNSSTGSLALPQSTSTTGDASDPNSDTSSSPQTDASSGSVFDPTDWNSVVAAAKGTTVTHVGYGGDDALNEWIMGPFRQTLKSKYDITLEYVQGLEFPGQLAAEKKAGVTRGSYDTMWINGLNFKTLKENDLLYGSYNQYLPQFKAAIDETAHDTQFDFTFPIEGYETPFSTAQLVFIHDAAVTPDPPTNVTELLEFAKAHPGALTYPQAEDFTGAAFIRTLIYDLLGHEQFMTMPADYETVRQAVEPAMDYLRSLNPYLWKEGKTFPRELTEVDHMFINGELLMMMSYGPYDVGGKIKKGIYTQTTEAFLFEKGTVANTSYYSIPFNSPNPAGAMVAINEMISPKMQLAKLAIAEEPFVTDLTRITPSQKELFAEVDLGPNNVPSEIMAAKRLPEYSSAIEQIITRIWLLEVVGKTN